MMTTQAPQTILSYIDATNRHDATAFHSLFADHAVVNDAGREIRGIEAIKTWSNHDIFEALVTLADIKIVERDGNHIITTKVDGNFDRTGLPDPLFIEHEVSLEQGQIVRLQCRLAEHVVS